jgi:hypothetical protein
VTEKLYVTLRNLTKEKSEAAKTSVVGTRGTKEMGDVDENVKVEWGGKGEKQACFVTSSVADVDKWVG